VPARVLLLRTLDHPVNSALPYQGGVIVETINGAPIHTLADVQAAFAKNSGRHHVLEFMHAEAVAVLDRAAADAAHPQILRDYAVPKDSRK
jgi:hypothetical protein